MKVKVVEKFRDKKTKEIRKVGEVFNVSKERFKEIIEVGPFVEEYKEESAETEKESK